MLGAANIKNAFVFFFMSVGILTADPLPTHAQETTFVAKGPIVIDVLGGLDWMRCSIGQVWENDTCVGSALLVPFASVASLIERAERNIGPGWRLPSREELERLIVINPEPPMIDQNVFPNTYPGLYWTGDTNWLMSNAPWSINFFTSYAYGRADEGRSVAVRLVRPR